MGIELQLQPQDVELIKQGKKENPTWVKVREKAVKWIECPKYEACLSLAYQKNVVNWSCLNCSFVKDATVKDLVIFHARKTLNKLEIAEVLAFEKTHHIKSSKTDNQKE